MPTYNTTIKDFVSGDSLEIERTVSGVPTGQSILTAWFTVKKRLTDADIAAVIQKVITSINDNNVGVILDSGSSGTATIVFYLLPEDTTQLIPLVEYYYDIQVMTDVGDIYTPETGIIYAHRQVTVSIV